MIDADPSYAALREPFYTPEQIQLLRTQHRDYIAHGLHHSFMRDVDSRYDNIPDRPGQQALQASLSRGVRTEAPVRLTLIQDSTSSVNTYFLDMFDPITGEIIVTDDDMDLINVWVVDTSPEGAIVEQNEHFSAAQITLLVEQGKQLADAGLVTKF